nr:hypothetical protein [Staphylococcus pseudintermedius]
MYRKSPSLMELVVRPDNKKAIKVKKKQRCSGIDGMKVSELHAHFAQYFSRITKNCLMVHINLKQFESSNSQTKWENACAWYSCR